MQFKKYTKQRRRSIQGLRSFKDTLPKNIKRVINKKGHIYSETLNNWKYIVGDDLFKVCYPKSFKNSNRFLETFKKISKTSIRGWNNDLLDNSFLIDNNKIYLKLRGLQVYNFRQKINKYMVRKNKHMRKNLAEKNVNFLD